MFYFSISIQVASYSVTCNSFMSPTKEAGVRARELTEAEKHNYL